MSTNKHFKVQWLRVIVCLLLPFSVFAQAKNTASPSAHAGTGELILLGLLVLIVLVAAIYLFIKTNEMMRLTRKDKDRESTGNVERYLNSFNIEQIETYLKYKETTKPKSSGNRLVLVLSMIVVASLYNTGLFAQTSAKQPVSLFSEGGIIITLILILTPILVGIILMIVKVVNMTKRYRRSQNLAEVARLTEYLKSLPEEEITDALRKRKAALDYKLSHNELSGSLPVKDDRGIITNVNEHANIRFIAEKRKALKRPEVDPQLSKLVIWFLITATVWLVFGTSVGEYIGIKFVAPDADHLSWLSFGRLRPVHTNAVFWGWSSLGMLGLGYYVVPRVGNVQIHSIKWGWYTLLLINAAVLFGSIALMAGINNGGGEYREYIWPIQLLFGIGLAITLANFLKTVARRKTREIYVSNWYIIAAVMFAITISLVAYLPFWQNGLGETITQGYYMHQGVGMWFMLFTLGLVYYYLPQQLNKPIYSYSLGILAFWSQIFFYTLIGTHHFVFSAIPWSLQTVAIIGSVGMVIPVVSGTTNFIMTFKGSWHKVSGSYTLPFFIIGIIFYFTGSLQGTAEAFRFTNLAWHFTDFTVAHSHLTMYGIIAFFLWAGIYAIIPRITRQEPPQITVGIHFWMAFIGLLFYSIPLMVGGTLKGMMWMDGKPFIDGVSFMAPYWLWRAIGGTLMWTSHLVFAFNMYKMIRPRYTVNINEEAIEKFASEDHELVDVQ
ncbi:cytochrome oxidase subunit I [Ilyomonas limi]|uniref:Cytochrome oxidase subunit I n=1 Tax=Ilyomonas limi TaxID=2575867 RepID=A0A4U3L7K6_9BACT|nr:cbb3-type cytochrome c oxidase subunit I [Ilyomonas limi]TKK71012.1 cytochrome oxidase subunit I [Ilyomonas limi]